ncbi:hypothetical protein AN189_12350 [Loktanella sp. 3ANDIMAR09]|uniref:DUF1353 domain-containing protein n=1 Tax=Loktanella sp. 3ANDIMAR09 TaxID=1225657 RepID=UPI0006F5FFDC|nr:DUF1353 domain-containing protein [Loktanella sp. 3ANDIMAR09]KQI68202.1 hypothetical protein AN189_12350 [Loktanella sp. 3ANDIMAR09]
MRIDGTDRYRLTGPVMWEIGVKGSGLWVSVPRGRGFDVSVPRGLHWAVSPHDPRYLKAAALHDDLLARGWDRVTAGAVFHDALRADGVGPVRRLAMLLAVILWRWS